MDSNLMKSLISLCKYRFFVFFILPSTFLAAPVFAHEQLVFAVDLIRHGDRTPVNEFPSKPYAWKKGLGELTTMGAKQEWALGRAMRKKYIIEAHLLPISYDQKLMYVRSTDFARTIQSANAFLEGLYPPTVRLNAVKIPITAIPKPHDKLLAPGPNNDVMSVQYRKQWIQTYWVNKTNSLQDKLNRWSKATGITLDSFTKIGEVGDNLYIRQIHHVPLPKGINAKEAKEIIDLGNQEFVDRYKLASVSHPTGHAILGEITKQFELATQKKTTLRYILFSAHDSTIMSVMNTLGSPLNKPPKYASRLNFSLYKNDNHYFVKVSLNDKPVLVPACGGEKCLISKLKTIK